MSSPEVKGQIDRKGIMHPRMLTNMTLFRMTPNQQIQAINDYKARFGEKYIQCDCRDK